MNLLFKRIIIIYILSFEVIYCAKKTEIPQCLMDNNFSWIIDGIIGGIAKPETPEQIKALHDLNVGLLVSLIEDVDPKIFNGIEIEHLTLPIPDSDPRIPTVAQVDQFIKKAKDTLKYKGKATVVHCQVGMGRTGTMLTCWLLANKDITPEQAIIFVRSRRIGSAADNA